MPPVRVHKVVAMNLRTKLIWLLSATVATSLGLVALVFLALVARFEDESTRTRLADTRSLVEDTLSHAAQAVEATAQRLAAEPRVRTVTLLASAADDSPAGTARMAGLAETLRLTRRHANLALLMLQDAEGAPLVWATADGPGMAGNTDAPNPVTIGDGPMFRRQGDGLSLIATAPIPGPEGRPLGHLIAGRTIAADALERLGRPDHVTLTVAGKEYGTPRDSRQATIALPGRAGTAPTLVLTAPEDAGAGALTSFRDAVLAGLALSILLVVPVGFLFADRLVSAPVRRLLGRIRTLTESDLPAPGNSDLARLEAAFDQLIDTIDRREIDLLAQWRELRAILDHAPAMVFLKDQDGRYILVNRHFADALNRPAEDIVGRTITDLFPPEAVATARAHDQRVLAEGRAQAFEEILPGPDGPRAYLTMRFPLEHRGAPALCGIALDISDRKAAEQALALSRTAFEHVSEGILITDGDGTILEVNNALCRILGYDRGEVLGRNPRMFASGVHDAAHYRRMWRALHREGQWQGEVIDRARDGHHVPLWVSIAAIREGESTSHYVAVFSDITRIKETEARLQQLAHFDELTTLPNRTLFRQHLDHAIARCLRHERRAGLMFIDLDRFKDVNDTLGHSAGDQLLEEAARRLKECVRAEDTVARLGGDEFTVILSEMAGTASAENVACRIIAAMQRGFEVGGTTVFISASVGIAVIPDDGRDQETLVRNADAAMYRAKADGRDTFRFYDPEMNSQARERLILENSLRQAIDQEILAVVYQPKVDMATRRLLGAEALVRWTDAELGPVSPARFIPVAEETGLVADIGALVLRNACRQARDWQAAGWDIPVAVNISSREFRDLSLVDRIADCLEATDLRADSLEIELTESALMEDLERVRRILVRLKDMGVRIALDDFGTGYSSLSYLKRLPVDVVKIDRAFVKDLPGDRDDASLVGAIISMAHSLRITPIAEGVETEDQAAFLLDLGCTVAQGFLFGRPTSGDTLIADRKAG